MTVLPALLVEDSMVWRVLREMAPELDMFSMAFLRLTEAESSPSARMMVALLSLSA